MESYLTRESSFSEEIRSELFTQRTAEAVELLIDAFRLDEYKDDRLLARYASGGTDYVELYENHLRGYGHRYRGTDGTDFSITLVGLKYVVGVGDCIALLGLETYFLFGYESVEKTEYELTQYLLQWKQERAENGNT